MKVSVSKELIDLYKRQHKNYDYAVSSVLDSLDPDSFVTCFKIVKQFALDGGKSEINIGDELAERIVSDLDSRNLNNETVELLLWMGAVFPEI